MEIDINAEYERNLKHKDQMPFHFDVTGRTLGAGDLRSIKFFVETAINRNSMCPYITLQPFNLLDKHNAKTNLRDVGYSEVIKLFGGIVINDSMKATFPYLIDLLNNSYEGMKVRFIIPSTYSQECMDFYKKEINSEVEYSPYDPWNLPDRVLHDASGFRVIRENEKQHTPAG